MMDLEIDSQTERQKFQDVASTLMGAICQECGPSWRLDTV